MTVDAEVLTDVAQDIERQSAQRWRDFQAKPPGKRKLMVELTTTAAALVHPQFSDGAFQLLACAAATATAGVGQRSCFCCDKRWSPDRPVVKMALIEALDGTGLRMIAGICRSCAKADVLATVLAAVQRDLRIKDVTTQHIGAGGAA